MNDWSIEKLNKYWQTVLQENKKYIVDETLAIDLIFKQTIDNGFEVEFDDVKTKVSIKKT